MDDSGYDFQETIETGPFCIHWDHPDDCDEKCKCGHECREHDMWIDQACEECDCEKFEDVEESE